jgi:hypothetical protein
VTRNHSQREEGTDQRVDVTYVLLMIFKSLKMPRKLFQLLINVTVTDFAKINHLLSENCYLLGCSLIAVHGRFGGTCRHHLVPPKRRRNTNGIHDARSQMIELFVILFKFSIFPHTSFVIVLILATTISRTRHTGVCALACPPHRTHTYVHTRARCKQVCQHVNTCAHSISVFLLSHKQSI